MTNTAPPAFPPPEPDELLGLFLGEAYDLFDDELLGDGTWDGHVLHEARTFATAELHQIARRLRELAAAAWPNRDLEEHLAEVLDTTLGPWQQDLRTGLRHTADLVDAVLRERSAAG